MIKVGDIVKANYGSVVFSFTYTATGKRRHLNIPVYGMLSTPYARRMLSGRIASLKKEGHLIFNTNIPGEILNGDTSGDTPEQNIPE